MQSGCPLGQGVSTPELPKDNIATLPVIHSENGMQTNMVANHNRFSVSEKEIAHPHCAAILKENLPSFSSTRGLINTESSPSVGTNANREPNLYNFSDERHKTHSVTAPSCEWRKIKKQDNSEEANFPSSASVGGQPSNIPPTNDQIIAFIETIVAPYRAASTKQSTKQEATFLNKKSIICANYRDVTLQSECNMPEINSVDLLTTPVSYEDDVQRQSLTFSLEKGGICPKAVETGRLHGEGMTEVPEKIQATSLVVPETSTLELGLLTEKDANTEKQNAKDPQHFQNTCKEIKEHSEKKALIQIISADHSCEGIGSNVHTESVKFSKNQAHINCEEPCHDEKTHYLKDPQYEDISDDDKSRVASKACLKDIHYDNMGEEEDLQNVAVEASLTKLAKYNKQLTFEHESCGHMLDQDQLEVIPDEQLVTEKRLLSKMESVNTAKNCSSIACTGFVELDDGFEQLSNLKCDCTFSALKNEADQMKRDDDDDDDDWIVIPVIGDVEFEPEEPVKEQGDLELVVLHHEDTEVMEISHARSPKKQRLHQTVPSDPPLASTSSQIEVYDTWGSYVQAVSVQFGFQNKSNPEGEPHTDESKGDSYSETEDSCDYSPVSEHNYLTVPRQLLKKTSVPSSSDTDDFLSENVTEQKVTKTQKGQPMRLRLRELKDLLSARAQSKSAQLETSRQKASEKDEAIVLDSDIESETDEQVNRAIKGPDNSTQETIIIIDSDTEGESDQIYEKGNEQTMSSGSVDGGTTRINRQLTEAKEHIQEEMERFKKRNENRQTTLNTCGSDKVLKKDYIYKKKPAVESTDSSGSEDSSTTSFATQNSPAAETVQCSYATTGKKPQNTASSKDSVDNLSQSVGKNADCTIQAPNPVIPRLYVEKGSRSNPYLKLSKDSRGTGNGETLGPENPAANKSTSGKDRHGSTNDKLQTNRTNSSLAYEKISSSQASSNSTSRSVEVRRRSASVGMSSLASLPKPQPGTLVPTQQSSSSRLKHSHSYSNPSTQDHYHTRTKDQSCAKTTPSLALKQVRKQWSDSHVRTKLDNKPKRGRPEMLRSTSVDSRREVRPGHKSRASRKRHSSQKSETPLSKRLKREARQRTMDINRTTSSNQSAFSFSPPGFKMYY